MRPTPSSSRFLAFLASTALLLAAAGCGPGAPAGAPPREGADAGPAVELVRHTVESDGHRLAVWEKSPADPAGVVLLLHGRTWSTLPDFDLQVPGEELSLMDGLVARGFAVYGLDQRGYGETPRDSTGWLTPGRAADDVARVLEWLAGRHPNPGLPHLFGWSQGSMIAQLTVQRRPDLVSDVILFGYPVDPRDDFEPGDVPDEPPREPTTAEAARSDFVTAGAISRRAIDAYVEAALEADPVRMDWREREAWNALDPARVTVPTLLLQGEHDPLALTPPQAALFTALGTAERWWVVVPGGDHAAFLETPRAYFVDALADFMSRER